MPARRRTAQTLLPALRLLLVIRPFPQPRTGAVCPRQGAAWCDALFGRRGPRGVRSPHRRAPSGELGTPIAASAPSARGLSATRWRPIQPARAVVADSAVAAIGACSTGVVGQAEVGVSSPPGTAAACLAAGDRDPFARARAVFVVGRGAFGRGRIYRGRPRCAANQPGAQHDDERGEHRRRDQ